MASNIMSLNCFPHKKAAHQSAAAMSGMSLSAYFDHSFPLDESDPTRATVREVTPEVVFVYGYRGGDTVPIGTLASVIRAEPDGLAYDGREPILIGPKDAISAILHRAGDGSLALTPAHLAMIEALRAYGN